MSLVHSIYYYNRVHVQNGCQSFSRLILSTKQHCVIYNFKKTMMYWKPVTCVFCWKHNFYINYGYLKWKFIYTHIFSFLYFTIFINVYCKYTKTHEVNIGIGVHIYGAIGNNVFLLGYWWIAKFFKTILIKLIKVLTN